MRRARGTRQGTPHATCQGTCQVAMLNVSILMYLVEVCAVLRRAELLWAMPRLCSIALWIESSFASES
eukprot:8829692-Pyramimonas_sp.AAC.1